MNFCNNFKNKNERKNLSKTKLVKGNKRIKMIHSRKQAKTLHLFLYTLFVYEKRINESTRMKRLRRRLRRRRRQWQWRWRWRQQQQQQRQKHKLCHCNLVQCSKAELHLMRNQSQHASSININTNIIMYNEWRIPKLISVCIMYNAYAESNDIDPRHHNHIFSLLSPPPAPSPIPL